jgi:7,8-dihydropterin-6-yl-methyl-4-(beta-D-ribofuranosyl)aminobenzene 5'-phosphate synthase
MLHKPPPRTYTVAAVIAVIIGVAMLSPAFADVSAPSALRLQVVFDNVRLKVGLETGWGFACLIEGLSQVILFDTGADGRVLLANLEKIGVKAENISIIFLSHEHDDHTGGLKAFLQRQSRVTVYLPASFPDSIPRSILARGAQVKNLREPAKLLDQVYTSGEMGGIIREQSLVLDTPRGLVILTGCAHPGIVEIVNRVKAWFGKEVYLVMGGFHLEGQAAGELQQVGTALKNMGVQKLAPSHCTGEAARKVFRQMWGQDFLESGVGALIEVPATIRSASD